MTSLPLLISLSDHFISAPGLEPVSYHFISVSPGEGSRNAGSKGNPGTIERLTGGRNERERITSNEAE